MSRRQKGSKSKRSRSSTSLAAQERAREREHERKMELMLLQRDLAREKRNEEIVTHLLVRGVGALFSRLK